MTTSEVEFVAQYWLAASEGRAEAGRAQAFVGPEMFSDSRLGKLYGILAHRHALGDPVGVAECEGELAAADLLGVVQYVGGVMAHCETLLYHAERVYRAHQARKQLDLLRLGVEEAERSLEKPERARKVAERLSMALLDVFASDALEKRPQTREELIADQFDRMDREDDRGLVLPWPKMQAACGPWMPGDLIGLTGYSGSGKSTVTANLAIGFARRGVPVIVFPTEMREQWLTRAAAAYAKVPQWIAEKGLWKKATDEHKRAFRRALEELRPLPWELVNRSNVTPAELVAAVRTLRRKYAGQRVVVVVDHMHRLDYGDEEADSEAGKATRMLKNFATDDRDGLTFVLLYQPKKPEADHAVYMPIHANRIRGHSMIWNELDVHLSVFRSWVERVPFGMTEWGTPAGALTPDGAPKVVKPLTDGAVVDEEHVYLKADKRRVGGEGRTFWLDFHQPSGNIFERASGHAEEAA